MKDKYPFKEIEEKWRKYWERNRIYEVDLKNVKKPFYNLMMFPYPSAEGLHVGNVFAFVGSDIQGRFHRMHEYDVFEPMGFDAFGIHSENFAMKTGSHPARLVPENILNFRENQLKKIGNMYDWSHSVDTTAPSYYRWTQWIFLQLYKAGLAYRAKAPVNWCPSCKTVLASEQVIANSCERCSKPVIKRELTQWFFRITEFAEELLNNLENLQWSERTKIAQKNWIGRSEGARIIFDIEGHNQTFEIFTTRPDTIFGVTYLVVAPEHPMLDRIVTARQRHNLEKYKEKVAQRSEIERQVENTEKEGVFTGAYAINPVNDERIPIWVSDYVLMGYGTGAIMAVPAHDQRDFEFAQEYDLEIRPVIAPPDGKIIPLESAYAGEGVLVNSGQFNNLTTSDAALRIVEWLEKYSLGKYMVQYRLRDWCISRQRYWGPPIPIIYCDTCGIIPVPERELPVLLPEIEDYMPDGSGDSPLLRDKEFFHTKCPRCGGDAVRETDVSDNFLCSAWYFLRYPSAQQSESAFDSELTSKWLPIDLYVGGNEHAVLHLLYSRFLCMVLNRIGLIDFEEPFKRFIAHGLIVRDGVKMSKSKGNVINPVEYIERYGADTLRVYLMFMGDYLKGGDFSDDGIKAMHAFLERIWKTFHEIELDDHSSADSETLYWLHSTIKAVTFDIRRFSYNTALARLMELLNFMTTNSIRSRLLVEAFIKLLSPFAPHISEELWAELGHGESITKQSWPDYREEYATKKSIEFVIQINGKVRAKININKGMDEQEVEALVLDNPVVQKWIKGKQLIKKVFVPDRLVNLVIK